LATGASWRQDGVGRANEVPVKGSDRSHVLTPDDIIAGKAITGPVLVFDDDHYYMGGVLCEKLRGDGHDVMLVTPASDVSTWTHNTMEQERIQARLMELGVQIVPLHNLVAIRESDAELACVYTDRRQSRHHRPIRERLHGRCLRGGGRAVTPG